MMQNVRVLRTQCICYDNTAYVDYMDLDVWCPRKAVKFNHSLTVTNSLSSSCKEVLSVSSFLQGQLDGWVPKLQYLCYWRSWDTAVLHQTIELRNLIGPDFSDMSAVVHLASCQHETGGFWWWLVGHIWKKPTYQERGSISISFHI